MATPEAQLALAAVASVATFSYALSTPSNSTSRYAAVALLAALQYTFATASARFSEYGDMPYAVVTLTLTLFWHAVDYLLVLRASSPAFIASRGAKPTALKRYVWTPLGLLANWRRLGTQWRISQVPPFSHQNAASIPSRASLILKRLLGIGGAFVVIDLSGVATVDMTTMMDKRALFSRLDQVTPSEAWFRVWLLACYTINAMAGVYLAYASITVIALASRLSSPAACPPMFGSISDAYSVRRCWG